MALFYNAKEFAKNKLTVPTTWTQFASKAAALHEKDSSAAITNFDPESTQDVLALMQQYNAFPFTYSGGSTLGIHFTGSAEMAFANYWQSLIDKKEVTTAGDFTPQQWAAFDSALSVSKAVSICTLCVKKSFSFQNDHEFERVPDPPILCACTAVIVTAVCTQ